MLGFSQQNCSNPLNVVICPDVLLTGQTNLGMLDDAPPACNLPGEDLVYKVSITNGAQKLFVSVLNATFPMRLILQQNGCNGSCNSYSVPAGNSNMNFTVTPSASYFVWLDAAVTVNYDIAFGADTGTVFINIPNTQGNLQFDSSSCNIPVFHPSKPFFQVKYNNVFMTHPMTLAPLFTPGTMCITVYFKNTTGIEGIKKFEFGFNGTGYMNISTADSIPGFYNPGYWRSYISGTKWTYLFEDAALTGKGDFTGTPNSCLAYEFCFNVTPLSNDPLITDVAVVMYSDGFGAGFSGNVPSGCCPSPTPNCMGSGGGSPAGSGQAFGFGFADPGNPLPIHLLSFTAEQVEQDVLLQWATATEINNNYFTIERSKNGIEWLPLGIIPGAGNSNNTENYFFTDKNPLEGKSYYRLKQTDYDGQSSYSKILYVSMDHPGSVEIFPIPADDKLTINFSSLKPNRIYLYNTRGSCVQPEAVYSENSASLNTESLPSGLYVIHLLKDDLLISKQKIIVMHRK